MNLRRPASLTSAPQRSGQSVWGLGALRIRDWFALTLLLSAGCFQEMSFPIRPGDYHPLPSPPATQCACHATETPRAWLVRAARELCPLLEPGHERYLTTDVLSDGKGQPRDVHALLDRPEAVLNNIFCNFYGFKDTVQAASQGWATDHEPTPWPGFEQVWIPVSPELSLSGRLGFATGPDGAPRKAPCIVLLPGLFGDNSVLRTRDLATSLRTHGFHTLALELRGHGQTDRRYPDVFYTFGVLECEDLMRVSEWLEDTFPHVDRTGLIGACWGGNLGLLAAWYDGRPADDPSIGDTFVKYLPPPSPRRHFTAGIVAFSTLLRWEKTVEETETPHSILGCKPIVHALQTIVEDRMRMKRHPWVGTKLRVLIDYEFCRSELTSEFPMDQAYLFLRFVPYRGLPCPPKLEAARVPVLLIHAANDMFAAPQAVADLMAVTQNPNVAALILRGGGHVGFFPYNRSYIYSLLFNFFDPQTGPVACGNR